VKPLTSEKTPILGLSLADFMPLARRHGMSLFAAQTLYRGFHRRGEVQGGAFPDWIADARRPIKDRHVDGETVKFTMALDDGLETETVIIPMRHKDDTTTRTLCVSSQVGCAMGCRFCETAQMGLMRSLSAAEIVAQLHAARFMIGDASTGRPGFPIKNVVFMGMGEPMDNIDAVLGAIQVMTDRNAYEIAPIHVTVSTVGRTDGIRRYGEFVSQTGFHRLNLAVSLNAPNDRIRSEIMPINRSEPIADLMAALMAFPKRVNAAICVEYVLIPGVNDAPEHCDEVCALLRPLHCSLNVIPYNPRRNSPWPAPDEDRVQEFVARAIANGQFCKRRGTKGRSAMAACGQLGNENIRARKFVEVDHKERVQIRVVGSQNAPGATGSPVVSDP
jgi:23S rRNA (adenine2503-C2)-methyltransferase